MKKRFFILPLLMCLTLCVVCYVLYSTQWECKNTEGREERLNRVNNLHGVNIASEITVGKNIICGYVSENDMFGIAIFEPTYLGGYSFTNNVNCSDDILIAPIIIEGTAYDLFWADIADLQYAEITYKFSNASEEHLILNASNNDILCQKAPAKDYSVKVTYVDSEGNRHHS